MTSGAPAASRNASPLALASRSRTPCAPNTTHVTSRSGCARVSASSVAPHRSRLARPVSARPPSPPPDGRREASARRAAHRRAPRETNRRRMSVEATDPVLGEGSDMVGDSERSLRWPERGSHEPGILGQAQQRWCAVRRPIAVDFSLPLDTRKHRQRGESARGWCCQASWPARPPRPDPSGSSAA
jgi:hypothetical protein